MFFSRLRHKLGFGPTVAVVTVGTALTLVGLRQADYEVSKVRTVDAVTAGCRSNVCVDRVQRKGGECYQLAAKTAPLRNRLDHNPWRTSWFFDVDMTMFSDCVAGRGPTRAENGLSHAPDAGAVGGTSDAGSSDAGADTNEKGAP